ncbi:MAG: LacI family DNA-binding transcriptional regulator [Armatimonadota bacterium]
MPSVRQLAKLAGVSTATVSMALRNHPRISAFTRQRIQELAQTYQYRVSPVISKFSSARCGTIGYIVPVIGCSFFGRVVEGILTHAFAESYHVVILPTHGDFRRMCLAIETLVEQQVDGILLHSGHAAIPAEVLLELASHDIPIVCTDFTPVPHVLDQIDTNETRLAELAVDYLFMLGHRRIAYAGPSVGNPRALALRKSAQRYGMALQCVVTQGTALTIDQLLLQAFQRQPLPTAFIGNDDHFAALAVRYVMHRGLQVPRDVSVLGCGNLQTAEYAEPPLTSIEQCPEELGRRAFSLLLQRMQERTAPEKFKPETVLIEPRLIIRQSCAPPRHVAGEQPWKTADIRETQTLPVVSPSSTSIRKRQAAKITWRSEDTIEALSARFHNEAAPDLRPRWQALWLLRQGYARAEVAREVGVNPRTLRDWLAWYRAGGASAVAAHRLRRSTR